MRRVLISTKPFIFVLFPVGVTVRSAESLSSAIPLGTSTERANSERANHGRSRLFQDAVSSVSFCLRSFPVCGWRTRSLSSVSGPPTRWSCVRGWLMRLLWAYEHDFATISPFLYERIAPSAATRADLSGSSRGSPADALGDLRVTVRASPPGNNNLLLHLYIAFLDIQIALHSKGAISSSTTNVQHPPGWCDGSHSAPERPPHTSILVERRQSDEANQCMGMIRRPWWSEASGLVWPGCRGNTPTLFRRTSWDF